VRGETSILLQKEKSSPPCKALTSFLCHFDADSRKQGAKRRNDLGVVTEQSDAADDEDAQNGKEKRILRAIALRGRAPQTDQSFFLSPRNVSAATPNFSRNPSPRPVHCCSSSFVLVAHLSRVNTAQAPHWALACKLG
jgi:hypothetical protein